MISTDAIGSSDAPREAIKHQKTSEITYAFHIWVFLKKLHHVTIATHYLQQLHAHSLY
jgi:hypothetical protein